MDSWKSPIPRDVHFIWIGTQKVPDYFTKYFLKSFQENMPEFSLRLWTNKDLTKNNFPKTYSYIQQSKRYHGKIITFRCELLIMPYVDGKKYPYTKKGKKAAKKAAKRDSLKIKGG